MREAGGRDDFVGRIAREIQRAHLPADFQRQRPDVDARQQARQFWRVQVKFYTVPLRQLRFPTGRWLKHSIDSTPASGSRASSALQPARRAECACQDSAFQRSPVEKMSPLIFSLPFSAPMRLEELDSIRTSFATGLPCLVMTMPWSSTWSSRERHCSLNLDALMMSPCLEDTQESESFILTSLD